MLEGKIGENKALFVFSDKPGRTMQIRVVRFAEAHPGKACEIVGMQGAAPPFPVAWVVADGSGSPSARTISVAPFFDLSSIFADPGLIPDGMRYINLTEEGIKRLFSLPTAVTGKAPERNGLLARVDTDGVYSLMPDAPLRVLSWKLSADVAAAATLASSAQQGEHEMASLIDDLLDRETEAIRYVFVRLTDERCGVLRYRDMVPYISEEIKWPLYDAEINAGIVCLDGEGFHSLANEVLDGWILEEREFVPASIMPSEIDMVYDEVFFMTEGNTVQEKNIDKDFYGVAFCLEGDPADVRAEGPYDDGSLLPFWNQVFSDLHIEAVGAAADRVLERNMKPGSLAWEIKALRFPDPGTPEYAEFFEYVVSSAVLGACTGKMLPARDAYAVRNEEGDMEFLRSVCSDSAVFFRPRAFIDHDGEIFRGTGGFYWRDGKDEGFDSWVNYPSSINALDRYQSGSMAYAAQTRRVESPVAIVTPEGEEKVITAPVFLLTGEGS